MEKIDIDEIVDYVIAQWAPGFVRSLEASARKKTKKASGAAHDSFDYVHLKATSSHVSQVVVMFKRYLRYQDMRKSAFNYPDHGEIAQWIENKGVNHFIGKHKRSFKSTLPDKEIANRIAWGIIIGKGKSKIRRRRWYNKTKSKGLQDLHIEVLNQVSTAYLQSLKTQTTNGKL